MVRMWGELHADDFHALHGELQGRAETATCRAILIDLSEARGKRVTAAGVRSLKARPLLLPEDVVCPPFAYVSAFDIRRRKYFGDPGLRWTVSATRCRNWCFTSPSA